MKKHFRTVAKISLILVYLVIVAGAVVRMTGSGMGCPDWPKCFGYYIPPTEKSELLWQAAKEYAKGQVIIKDEALLVANTQFTAGTTFNPQNWKKYTKHDYTIFNAWHTWIEYINRLLGALAGLATLAMAVLSISFWKKNKKITLLSWLVVIGMLFQAWLGATVVYSVLEPAKITVHMVMALVIVALILYLIHQANSKKMTLDFNKKILATGIAAVVLTLAQIILGTQVRQFIDHQVDVYGYQEKIKWLAEPTILFYIHRSFSILVLLVNGLLAYHIYKLFRAYKKTFWVLVLLFTEVLTGLAMYHLDFPFASQPLHLVIASILFGVQFYIVLDILKHQINVKLL